jgi:hypothetical protein
MMMGIQRGFLRAITCVALAGLGLGAPLPTQQQQQQLWHPSCYRDLVHAPLEVKGVGVEDGGNWTVVQLGNLPEQLLLEGQSFGGCYTVSVVTSRGVLLRNSARQSERQFFMGGFSSVASLHEPRHSAVVISNQDFERRALAGARITPVSKAVDRIDYPSESNYAHLPKIVFHNTEGEAFYSRPKSIGVTVSDKEDPRPEIAGVQIAAPPEGSLLSSLGLREGQKIVRINSQMVDTVDDISQRLASLGDTPLTVSYFDPASGLIMGAHGMVASRVQ